MIDIDVRWSPVGAEIDLLRIYQYPYKEWGRDEVMLAIWINMAESLHLAVRKRYI